MSAPPTNRWRGVPADERLAERRARLLDAGFDLLGSEGLSGTTVRGVCEGARLNPRYFYESFEDLDALLVAVFERTAGDASAVMLAAPERVRGPGCSPLDEMRAGLGAFVAHTTEDPRRVQVLFAEGLGNEALSRRRVRAMLELAETLALLAREEDGADDDPIFTIAANVMVGGMAELLITWLHGHLAIDLGQLVDDAAKLFVATRAAAREIAVERRPVA